MTLPISVPLSWKHDDDQEGNVDLFTADSGVRVGYTFGIPRRTLTAECAGDVARWRDALRGTIRAVVKYEAHPLVIVPDALNANLSMLYSRYMGGTDLENDGWRFNYTTQRWETVGDISMKFEEYI